MKELQIIHNKEHSKEDSYTIHVKLKQELYFVEHFSMNMICLCYEKIKIRISSSVKKMKEVSTSCYGDTPDF